MTALTLQLEIKNILINLFKDKFFKNDANENSKINTFIQFLPDDLEDEFSKAPYILIKLLDGDDLDESKVRIALIVLTYDESPDYQGYQDSILIVEDIRQKLLQSKTIKNFELDNLKWYPHDENTYPYYFAIIETEWIMPKIEETTISSMI